MNRLEIGQEHCRFVKDTRTRNAIIMFIIRKNNKNAEGVLPALYR